MGCRIGCSAIALVWMAAAPSLAEETVSAAPTAVVCAKDASFPERLAAKEIRRYVYLRTGALLPLVHERPAGAAILVGAKEEPLIRQIAIEAKLQPALDALGAEQYLLKTVAHVNGNRGPVLLVAGGDPAGTLYGAYRLAEHLGVRFYLHGDVVPDRKITLAALQKVDEVEKPLFDRRGVLSFHDFPEGPDWWSAEEYKAIIGQLPKMRMNFFGLHTYPQSEAGPEPLVWIGPPGEIGQGAKVKASYRSRHFTTSNVTRVWGYNPMKTSDYLYGTSDWFDRDDFGADYMKGTYPWNRMSPQQCNDLFERMGETLNDAFTFARRLGVKTCLGTETPLTIPDAVKARLKAAGKDPGDPAVVRELYEGMFRRIAETHPLDYYWFWTYEGWPNETLGRREIDSVMADFQLAIAAAQKIKVPFTLATCGWALGPPREPSLFDRVLPKNMPLSCISGGVGYSPVEPAFARIEGRPKWSIPWLEDDPSLIQPQLWAGRMRRDAADSLAYGCTGLMGIHWRTRILAPNVSALAKAAWNQDWNKPGSKTAAAGGSRFLPVDDFYLDWAAAEFGQEAAAPIAAIFARIDGHLPRPANWGLKADRPPWEQVAKDYAFVDELAQLRPRVRGRGELDRFDYWLNTFRYFRALDQIDCSLGKLNTAMQKVRAEKDPAARRKLARELALPVRQEIIARLADVNRFLLSTVSNFGELGTVCNWQQHVIPRLPIKPDDELAKILGDLPVDALPTKEYIGEPRLIVPTVRTELVAGEPLKLTVIAAGFTPQDAALYWRPLGSGSFKKVPLVHVARSVYRATLPAESIEGDFEYNIRADGFSRKMADRQKRRGKSSVAETPPGGHDMADESLVWPITAPQMNQSVVVVKE